MKYITTIFLLCVIIFSSILYITYRIEDNFTNNYDNSIIYQEDITNTNIRFDALNTLTPSISTLREIDDDKFKYGYDIDTEKNINTSGVLGYATISPSRSNILNGYDNGNNKVSINAYKEVWDGVDTIKQYNISGVSNIYAPIVNNYT